MKNTAADIFFTDGCGRCSLGGTPACKVHLWEKELEMMREILLGCNLQEERKWGVPCYTYQNKNIALLGAFKEYCAISFFKGSLLEDAAGVLSKPGENSQAARLFRFTGLQKIEEMQALITSYVFEAIEIEKAGIKVAFKKIEEHAIPEEFQRQLDTMPALKAAFHALTPGRQRAYLLHFSGAKQAATRASRIEKCIPRILEGRGFNE